MNDDRPISLPPDSVERPNESSMPAPEVANSIARALDRLESALARRADFGRSTHRSITTLSDGLRCSTTEEQWSIDTDLPTSLGGTGASPTPGTLVRAALGSCLAMGYRLRAARQGVELRSIQVTVETDSEIAGMLVPGAEAPPGYREVRYHVEITSSAPPAAVRRVVDEADRLSPVLDVCARANTVSRTLSIRPGGAAT